jgi:hypothetical protein
MGRARNKIPEDETIEQKRERWRLERQKYRAQERAAKRGVFETWRHRLNEDLAVNPKKIEELLSTSEDVEAFTEEAEKIVDGRESDYGYSPSEVWRMLKEAATDYGTITEYPLESAVQGWRDDVKTQEPYNAFIRDFPDKHYVEYGLKTKLETKLIIRLRNKLLAIAAKDARDVDPEVLAEITANFLEEFAGLCRNNFETFWLMLSSAPIGRLCLRCVGIEPYTREPIVVEPQAGIFTVKLEPLEDRKWEDNGLYNYSVLKQQLSSDAERARYNELLRQAKQKWDAQSWEAISCEVVEEKTVAHMGDVLNATGCGDGE